MPYMRLRALSLVARTPAGDVGRTLTFSQGLNLLRADNTSGKSMALQAIIFALGLEGMLSATHRVPLPHAMTDSVVIDGREQRVDQSHVRLEIENGKGEILTVKRSVVGTDDGRLMRVSRGPAITKPGVYREEEYFVRTKGAAQNAAGFHRVLADFVGFDLPKVSKLDGSEAPLYMETLFPYFYVEQKHGWSGIQARMPNYLKIRDVGRRSAEFVLGLEAFQLVLARQRIQSNMAELEAKWQDSSKNLDTLAKSAHVVVRNQQARIAQPWSAETSVPSVSISESWLPLSSAISRVAEQLERLKSSEVSTVAAVAPQLENALPALEAALQRVTTISASLWAELSERDRRIQQISDRLEALGEDLQRHRDSRTLEGYGAEHAHDLIAQHICPTCHQDFQDGSDISAHAMTIAENIAFIERQQKTFRSMLADQARVRSAVDARLDSLAVQSNEYRQEIRAAKDTLASPSAHPATSDIRRRLQAEERLDLLKTRESEFEAAREEIQSISRAWVLQKAELTKLSHQGLTAGDERKLAGVERSLRQQLGRYGFRSIEPDAVDIDRESYRPVNEGFDLGFDVSASDMIRVIWGYLFAMMEVGVASNGGHLGLLIFDEPRQQETARPSYQALLAVAVAAGKSGKQVLFATSEESGSLRAMLEEGSYTLIDLPPMEKLLQPTR
jgi:hypothetical protein